MSPFPSRWVLSSLTMLGRLVWISDIDLARFIMASQDAELGGIADRPGNLPDPFHTLFGLAGLSLLARKGTAAASFSDRLTVDGHSDTQIADSCTVEALADQISKETEKVDKLDSKYQIGTAKGDSVREPAESTSQIDNLESVAENKLQAVSNVPQSIMETSLCLAMCGKRLRPINPVYCLPQHVVDRLAIDVPLLR
ncbi:unnamed protein product [Protopolystoma xenopodis]|uniref:Geranylgeranyl transferase type II subunit beta n=1 Tax=Protopolystoma xenopodis TaxID=117903 RepID=A0A3S5BL85_9PLAT|nr:unnamed protein product [Protopolystoma xenopodis]